MERKEREAKNRKMQKQAVSVIETYYSLRLIRKELIKNKDYLWTLPHDCRVLWVRFRYLKNQTGELYKQVKNLRNEEEEGGT